MSSDTRTVDLILQIDTGPDADAEEVDRLTRQLLGEIRELEVESVELVSAGPAPKGTKAGDVISLGALSLAVLPPLLPDVFKYLQGWGKRGVGRRVRVKTHTGDKSVEVEYEPSTMSLEDLRILVNTLTQTLETTKGDTSERSADS